MEGTSDKTQEIHPTLILEAQRKPLQVVAVASNKVLFHYTRCLDSKDLTPSTVWKYEQEYMHIRHEGKTHSGILVTILQPLLSEDLHAASTTN